jgi:hypothetical protein
MKLGHILATRNVCVGIDKSLEDCCKYCDDRFTFRCVLWVVFHNVVTTLWRQFSVLSRLVVKLD